MTPHVPLVNLCVILLKDKKLIKYFLSCVTSMKQGLFDIYFNPHNHKHLYFPGYGLFTSRTFEKGSFLLEYRGKVSLVSDDEEMTIEDSYVFHFKHSGVNYR